MTQTPAPILYLPHGGGPMPLLGDPGHAGMVRFLQQVTPRLGNPRAVLMVSAHWEAPLATLTGHPQPELIYDYYGFPPESYDITYPAPGDPELAERMALILQGAGIEAVVDGRRGFDHGMFVPLKVMYPQAAIPCVQLSLLAGLDPVQHIALGQALEPLRQEGVVIVGSGMSFHNLQAIFDRRLARSQVESRAFDEWLRHVTADPGLAAAERWEALVNWSQAPHARFCHPREEHLMPLHVCFGAAMEATPQAEVVYNEQLLGQWVTGLFWH